MTIKEKRKHIKPFLRFALKKLQGIKGGTINLNERFLCNMAYEYSGRNQPLNDYICERIRACQHIKATVEISAWNFRTDDNPHSYGIDERIEWVKWQLKHAKP